MKSTGERLTFDNDLVPARPPSWLNFGRSRVVPAQSKVDPSVVVDLLEGFRHSKTMFAAVSLGVFDALGSERMSLVRLREVLNVDADALERLLDACVGLQLLIREGDRYRNAPVAATYLCKDSPERLIHYVTY